MFFCWDVGEMLVEGEGGVVMVDGVVVEEYDEIVLW